MQNSTRPWPPQWVLRAVNLEPEVRVRVLHVFNILGQSMVADVMSVLLGLTGELGHQGPSGNVVWRSLAEEVFPKRKELYVYYHVYRMTSIFHGQRGGAHITRLVMFGSLHTGQVL
jgi:hypothetical protein